MHFYLIQKGKLSYIHIHITQDAFIYDIFYGSWLIKSETEYLKLFWGWLDFYSDSINGTHLFI